MAKAVKNTPRGSRMKSHASGTITATVGGFPNVAYIRPELRAYLDIYTRIDDCMAGAQRIREKRETYLPRPNASDNSPENMERYEAYLHRAVFYNVVFRTVHALVGQIFLRDPQTKYPKALEPIVIDANGEGITLDQTAKLTSLHALSIGRAGVHVDYATVPGGTTAADGVSGDYRPVIYTYAGHEIRNWRKARRGSRMVYTLIVVEEDYTIDDDGFENKSAMQYKVMRLISPQTAQQQLQLAYKNSPDDYGNMYDAAVTEAISTSSDVYVIEVWRSQSSETTNAQFLIAETYYPKGYDGKFLNEIPFKFVGSEQNDDSIDPPPCAALAEVNLGHWRNSADYEESVFLVGQPTPWVSGVTQEWNENVLKGNIQLGSRGVIALPAGGTAALMQADPNSLALGAMDKKERQMTALGAKLVEQRDVQRTATEAEMESTADTSILADIAGNVSDAIQWALRTACVFTGDNADEVEYVLNKEFDLTKMPADARQQLLLEYEADMITFEEMRANLRRAGIATLDDVTAKKELDAQRKEKADTAVLQANAMSKLNVKPVDPNATPTPTGNSPANTPT